METVQQLLTVRILLLPFRFKALIHLPFFRILNYWTASKQPENTYIAPYSHVGCVFTLKGIKVCLAGCPKTKSMCTNLKASTLIVIIRVNATIHRCKPLLDFITKVNLWNAGEF